MKANMTAMRGDATPQYADADPRQVARRVRGSVLLILGFALTAAALFGSPEQPATTSPAMRAPDTTTDPNPATPAIDPVTDDPMVTATVGDWNWEAAATTSSRHSGPYEVQELWLPPAE